MANLIYVLFALSGVAGLIYEGSWARYLKLFLGHASYGQVLTLCIYMGGLALGSFIAGKMVSKIKRPLRAYAITELGIGIGGFLYHPAYVAITNTFYDSAWSAALTTRQAEILKIFLAVGSTLPVAIALGMTFPFIAAGLMRLDKDAGEVSIPKLYFTNSFGAAFGILLASYILIPTFGNQWTLQIAGTFNFILAACFWMIDASKNSAENFEETILEPETAEEALPMPKRKSIWLLIAALTGLSSFVYEIVWIRLLSLLMGSSSHSFDQMLSAFIFGLALGSLFSRKFVKKDPLKIFALAQIFMAFFALCTLYFHAPFWTAMNEANQIFNATSPGYAAWSIFKYGLSVFWMVPTSFFAGMTLPLITVILTRAFRSEAPIGKVYGWNTLGSIGGSLLAGMVLIPVFQLKWTLVSAALLDLAIGVILLMIFRKKFRHSVLFYICLFIAVFPSFFMDFEPHRITSGAFRTYKDFEPDESIIVRNGKTATISFHESKVHYYVKTNGKADASLSKNRDNPIEGDELTQAATAFMPMAMHGEPYLAAMVGFGSGMGAHYLLADPLLERLDCVEIENEMMTLAKGFMPWNRRGYEDPRIKIFIDDARTFFHTHHQQYDMIISVPSNPWVSGVSSLFSREFYSHMKRYIKPGGHWVQWIQTYEFNDVLFLNILKALDVSFDYVAIYKAPEEPDVIIIAGDSPIRQEYIERFHTDSTLQKEFKTIGRPADFFGEQNFLFTTEMLRPVLQTVIPNSEFTPIVDNKAEEARFTKTEVKMVSAFDACDFCWPEILDSADYAPRLAFKNKVKSETPPDRYRQSELLSHLQDSATIDWVRFWDEAREWIRELPYDSTRNQDSVYAEIKKWHSEKRLPDAQALEFAMLDGMLYGGHETAGNALSIFIENYELNGLDEFFLRHAVLTAIKTGRFEDLEILYREGVRPSTDFSAVEKVLIERILRPRRI
ncbi:MAG: fused MFS/spermidine synthase [Fibrobacter sp.]|jgi:predicted membrane-bound spermidine synthase|nr:fused MFS/spermidine synthase [Fibrobacter sp.]